MDLTVPHDARERLTLRFGKAADAWCDALPGTVAEFARRWELEPVAQLGGGTSRVVVSRRAGDATVYLKLTPDPAVATQEAGALRLWDGCCRTPALLAADPARGALLLAEVAAPGGGAAPVLSGAGPVRLPRVAEVLSALRTRAPGPRSPLPSLSRRVDFVFDLTRRRLAAAGDGGAPMKRSGGSGGFGEDLVPAALVDACHRTAATLAASGPALLVHGDLHAGNVLDAGARRGFVAIDPRPSVGDPDFDAVDWALDGITSDDALRERIRTLAELVPGLDGDRLLGWCRACAVVIAGPRAARGRDDEATRWLLTLAASAARA